MKSRAIKCTLNSLVALSIFIGRDSSLYAASPYKINFINSPHSIIEPYLTSMGASQNQVMTYTGSLWQPTDLSSSLLYKGSWNANTNSPDLTIPSNKRGAYYLVTVGGTFGGVLYSAGDWLISNGNSWQKIDHSTNVVSKFNGRKGSVTLAPEDYVTLKNAFDKLPGSSINNFLDMDVASPADDNIFKYDSISSKWVLSVDNEGEYTYSGSPNKVMATNGVGLLSNSSATIPEINFLAGNSGPIQTQLNAVQSNNLLTGNILVGSIANLPTNVAVSGDATITYSGVLLPDNSRVADIELKDTGTPGTYSSITVDAQGRVTAGSNPATVITALTTDVTATGTGSVAATITTNAVTSAKILDGAIAPVDFDFSGSNVSTSGLLIKNVAGGFSSISCSTVGYVPVWTVTGFTCAFNGAGTVNGTATKISKFTTGTNLGDALLSESSTAVTLEGILALPTTSATAGQVTIDAKRFLHFYNNGIFLGENAGNFTMTGNYNVGLGYLSLNRTTTGAYNIAVGDMSGWRLTTGSNNTLLGDYAGNQLTSGNNNTLIGNNAGTSRAFQISNTFVGFSVGSMWEGNENTVVGAQAASAAGFGGWRNTLLGFQAGLEVQDNNNVLLGYKAGHSIVDGDNDVIIGGHLGANIASADNIILLADGEGNERMRVLANGNVGIGTLTPGYKLQVGDAIDGTEARAVSWVSWSDERLKKDFQLIPDALEKILVLNGYYYHWSSSNISARKLGVKAQEVEKVFPEVVSLGGDGYLSVSYDHLIVPVMAAFKEFYITWENDRNNIHQILKGQDKLLVETQKQFNQKFSTMTDSVQSLKTDSRSIRNYLCSKDSQADFCK